MFIIKRTALLPERRILRMPSNICYIFILVWLLTTIDNSFKYIYGRS